MKICYVTTFTGSFQYLCDGHYTSATFSAGATTGPWSAKRLKLKLFKSVAAKLKLTCIHLCVKSDLNQCSILWGFLCVLVAQSCLTLCDPMDCSPPGSSAHGDSPGKNTGVGCHALLQGVFPTQGSNPGGVVGIL